MALRILVTGKHNNSRSLLCDILSIEPGLEVVADAGTGQETVDYAISLCPDVIVLDAHLDGGKGLDLLRQIRAGGYGGRVIVTSQWKSERHRKAAYRSGADTYLGRHSSLDGLLPAIRGTN